MLAMSVPDAIMFPNWGFWAISFVVVIVVYLIGFRLGYKRARKD